LMYKYLWALRIQNDQRKEVLKDLYRQVGSSHKG